MPYGPEDAPRYTKKARTAKAKRAFSHAANSSLRDNPRDEGKAVRFGNAAARASARKSQRSKRKTYRK